MNSENKELRRYKKNVSPSLKGWRKTIHNYDSLVKPNCHVQCGWGRVLFASTFEGPQELINDLEKESSGQRDIAFYVNDPHVISSISPHSIFLDPSHTYRIWFENYRQATKIRKNIWVGRLQKKSDIIKVNAILKARKMVELDPKKTIDSFNSRKVINLIAADIRTGEIFGFVTGVDHSASFDDPEQGCSLWSLAVSPHCRVAGVGEALVRYLIEYFQARGHNYLDLSVMHHNRQAIQLYEKLGFERVPVYCVKRKNTINERLFTPQRFHKALNPYGQIIIDEAARRGIDVKIIDKEMAFFSLTLGARVVLCRESLTDQTSAVAMSQCADKRVTHRILKSAGLRVPSQISAQASPGKIDSFLTKYRPVVLKPASGEQGQGVKVGLSAKKEIKELTSELGKYYSDLILEEMVVGIDVRVIVIDGKFVAAAKRVPPSVLGDGRSKLKTLIQKLSRRRHSATQGESHIPIDDETIRTLKSQKCTLETVLKEGQEVMVRKTANLHTGGMIVDITPEFSEHFREVSVKAAAALNVPVVGLDLMIPNLKGKKYWIIEANERPGLANHEPQPTVERFIDFLFPTTKRESSDESSEANEYQ